MQAQAFLDQVGGARETRAPIASMTNNAINIISCYDAGGHHLADIAWRPHEARLRATDGLFLC